MRLVYLFFDALGAEAEEHRAEIRRFQELIGTDPLRFVPLSVQEFILRAEDRVRDAHAQYVDYLAERYL